MRRRRLVRLFETRRGNLDYRLRRDYLRNGVATVPCRISDYNDIISPYSAKGFETLNPDFIDHLTTSAKVIPLDCPIVLNIIGDCLSDEEKQTIVEVVREDFAYALGMVERQEKRHTRIFLGMLIGMILFGALLYLTQTLAEEPREVLFIPFWFMGETLCDYIFLTGHDLRMERREAGRLASIKVVFSDTYEDASYTGSEIDQLYSDIEKDVNETIEEEETAEDCDSPKNPNEDVR